MNLQIFDVKNLQIINVESKGIEELIPIYKTDIGKSVIKARDLHEALEIPIRYNDWVKTVTKGREYKLRKELFQKKEGKRWVTRNITNYILELKVARDITRLRFTNSSKSIYYYLDIVEKRIK